MLIMWKFIIFAYVFENRSNRVYKNKINMTKYFLSSAAKSVFSIVAGVKIESPLDAGAANRILKRCDSTAPADTIDMPCQFGDQKCIIM